MTDTNTQEGDLRARLEAQRAVLARLIHLLPEADRQAICDWLVRSSMAPDGQEDPGAVSIEGVPGAMARAAEFDELLARVTALRRG